MADFLALAGALAFGADLEALVSFLAGAAFLSFDLLLVSFFAGFVSLAGVFDGFAFFPSSLESLALESDFLSLVSFFGLSFSSFFF